MCGSSPRGRGTPIKSIVNSVRPRFIPARAGNTRARRRAARRTPVHPRAGGEHTQYATTLTAADGSSPRGRGTRRCPRRRHRRGRFIPARAGNTGIEVLGEVVWAVHPRAGGEHIDWRRLFRFGAGSSPRGRGTRESRPIGAHPHRFIPARAGNTRHVVLAISSRSVHPRAGGEHRSLIPRNSRASGSSPRGRGTRARRHPGRLRLRFIPARAGNTPRSTRRWPRRTVHPRAGGEHRARTLGRSLSPGSSPRGRGTRSVLAHLLGLRRFIPARAGNTDCRDARGGTSPVHPRAGGEHFRRRKIASRLTGSSPRGRGTRISGGG